MPLDVDVTPFDNSKTAKEGVSRTYKGYDGYAPMAAYLGREGYCLEFELREGKQHCQRGTPEFLTRVLAQARRVTEEAVVLRLDGGNDALDNVEVVLRHNETDEVGVDFLIKWNPRTEDRQRWLEHAQENAEFTEPRAGKRVWVFDLETTRIRQGWEYTVRRVMRVIERRIDKRGQALLVPEVEVEGWWTSLDLAWLSGASSCAASADPHGDAGTDVSGRATVAVSPPACSANSTTTSPTDRSSRHPARIPPGERGGESLSFPESVERRFCATLVSTRLNLRRGCRRGAKS